MVGGSSFDSQNTQHHNGKNIEQSITQLPPFTFDEWLKYNNLKDWPINNNGNKDDGLEYQMTPASVVLGSEEEIYKQLKLRAPFRVNILDEILNEVTSVEEKLNQYTSFFFDERQKKNDSIPNGNKKYRASFDLQMEQEQARGKIEDLFTAASKTIENAVFPGYLDHDLTSLPGALEAPQLLNRVTKLQDFMPSFKKTWKKFFLSEASVAILQDSFWWLFLHVKKKDTGTSNQSKLFNRLSSSFVSLFLSIPYEEKDEFFKYYPDCLSQAIYTVFCTSFPASSANHFDVKFRQEILNLMYEWVTGTHPYTDEIIKWWDLESLESKTIRENAEDGGPILKSSLSFDEETFYLPSNLRNIDDEGTTMQLFSPKKCTSISKSHPSGSGPHYERLAFNIYGRSPFIMHYLSSKELQKEDDTPMKIVTRTEIDSSKSMNEETYKELISNHKRKSKNRKDRYERITADVAQECIRLEKQKKKEQIAMIKAQKELMMKHFDVKILNQKIMDMMTQSDFSSRNVTSLLDNKNETS